MFSFFPLSGKTKNWPITHGFPYFSFSPMSRILSQWGKISYFFSAAIFLPILRGNGRYFLVGKNNDEKWEAPGAEIFLGGPEEGSRLFQKEGGTGEGKREGKYQIKERRRRQ